MMKLSCMEQKWNLEVLNMLLDRTKTDGKNDRNKKNLSYWSHDLQ